MKKLICLTRAGGSEADGSAVLVDAMEVSFAALKHDKSSTFLTMTNGHVLEVTEPLEQIYKLLLEAWQ